MIFFEQKQWNDANLNKLPGLVPAYNAQDWVLFPGEPAPLRLLTPQQHQMAEFALQNGEYLAVTRTKPDGQGLYKTATLARIAANEKPRPGVWNLALMGIFRITVQNELRRAPFNLVQISLAEQTTLKEPDSTYWPVEEELLEAADAYILRQGENAVRFEMEPALADLTPGALPLGEFTDVVGAALDLPAGDKQLLLEELHPLERAQKLLFLLRFSNQSQKHFNRLS
jgi:ATP-dependent Lon protease